jgi:hypothetical protein
MKLPTIDTISEQAFADSIQKYISWAAEWDGALLADTFLGVWADLQREKKSLVLKRKRKAES